MQCTHFLRHAVACLAAVEANTRLWDVSRLQSSDTNALLHTWKRPYILGHDNSAKYISQFPASRDTLKVKTTNRDWIILTIETTKARPFITLSEAVKVSRLLLGFLFFQIQNALPGIGKISGLGRCLSLLNAFSNESRWKHYGNKPVGGPEIEYLSAHLTEMQSYWFLLYSCWLPATALPSDPKIPSAVLSNSWWESGTTTLLNQTCVSWHTKNGNVQCWNCIWIRISR